MSVNWNSYILFQWLLQYGIAQNLYVQQAY